MAFRLPLRPLVLTALLASAAVAVSWAAPLQEKAAAAAEGEDLEEVMHGIDKNFEAVNAAIEKKDKAAALELTTKLQLACISAKTLTPPKLRTIEEKDKAAFIAGFRKGILGMLKSTADLEIALVDGNFDEAKKVAESMDASKKTNHDTYKKMPRKKKE